jgi:hypothetical protein
MADLRSEPLFQRAKSRQVREALDRLEGLVVEGLKHGFFDAPRSGSASPAEVHGQFVWHVLAL